MCSRRHAVFGHALDAVVAASAAPYGYTISVWSSGAILSHAHGAPDVLNVVLFALGALAGFVAVGLAATALACWRAPRRRSTLAASASLPGC